MSYLNRLEAGKKLSKALGEYEGSNVVILALPRGGMVLGAEVAKALKAPLGLVLVRKIGHPSYSEYAIGAIAEGDVPIYNEQERAGIDNAWLKRAESSARELLARRHKMYYGTDLVLQDISGKIVIIVDDGIATGLTMQAAIHAVRTKKPKQVIVAAPVASQESFRSLEKIADRVLVLDDPKSFLGAVGSHYQEFNQVSDEEVRSLLREENYDIQHSAAAYR
jgi:predicted phosphoribosyltransferase